MPLLVSTSLAPDPEGPGAVALPVEGNSGRHGSPADPLPEDRVPALLGRGP